MEQTPRFIEKHRMVLLSALRRMSLDAANSGLRFTELSEFKVIHGSTAGLQAIDTSFLIGFLPTVKASTSLIHWATIAFKNLIWL